MKRENLYCVLKKWWILLIPFIQSLLLLRLSPMMYDGWAGSFYYYNYGGLLNWTQYIFGPYRDWINGRVASNLICGLLESIRSEWLLDIVGALMLAAILLCLLLLLRSQHPLTIALIYSAMLALMPYLMRTYVIQIALPQYVPPVLFVLMALLFLREYESTSAVKWVWYLYPLTLLACCWMENSSLAYGVVLTFYCFRVTLKKRRVDFKLWGVVIVGICAGLFMMTSKGMRMSRIDPVKDSFLSFGLDRFQIHFIKLCRTFIFFAALANVLISLLLVNFAVHFWAKKKKSLLRITLCIVDISILLCFLSLGTQTGEFIYTQRIQENTFNGWMQQPLAYPMLLFVYLAWVELHVFLCGKNTEQNEFIWDLNVFAAVCLISILPTTQSEYRIYSPAYFVLIFFVCYIVSNTEMYFSSASQKMKPVAAVFICTAVVLAIDYQVQLCQRLYLVGGERDEKIGIIRFLQVSGEFDPDQYYILPSYSVRDAMRGGVTAIDTFHYPAFLQRYGLRQDTRILFAPSGDQAIIIADTNDPQNPKIQMFEIETGEFSYDYTVSYQPEGTDDYIAVIYESGLDGSDWVFQPMGGPGKYKIEVLLHDMSTGGANYLEPLELVLKW